MSSFTYNADVRLVIDGTGSMAPVIEGVKSLAGSVHDAIREGLDKQQKSIDGLRVGVTVFRDFASDGTDALVSSGFFKVPEQEKELATFINGISAGGGGDEPENSLEALASALQSEWTSEGAKQRHVTVLFTDATPHPYGAVGGSGKPTSLPGTLEEVFGLWRGDKQDAHLRQAARRLYLVVPPGVADYERWADEDLVAVMPINDVMASPEAAREYIVNTIVNSV